MSGSPAVSLFEHTGVRIQPPCLKAGHYDFAIAGLVTAAIAASLFLLAMIVVWYSSLMSSTVPDGIPPKYTSTLVTPSAEPAPNNNDSQLTEVSRPEDLNTDPSVKFDAPEVTEIDFIREVVPQALDSAAAIKELSESRSVSTALPGVADGGLGGPLGIGGERGRDASQRWVIEFTAAASLDEYAAGLQFFEIELAADFDNEDRVVWLSNPAAAKPTARHAEQSAVIAEHRFYTVWSEGSNASLAADRELFARAGVDASAAQILHFYPKSVERLLESLERAFADRQPSEIRRTCFCIRRIQDGFEFFVREQLIR